jgi:hypothetical protein
MNPIGTELIHQSSALSLVRNGSFTQGLAHWFGSYCTHSKAISEFGAVDPVVQAPRYTASIDAVHDEFYMDGVTPGLNQFIDRPDIFSFPAVRHVGGLRLVVLDSASALLMIQETLTTVDGVLLEAAPSGEYFQHPFLFRSNTATVPVKVGTIAHISDVRLQENSELYRVVKTWLSYNTAGASAPTVGQENAFTYHALEVVAPDRTFEPYASSENGKVALSLSDWTADSMLLTISGDVDELMQSDRNQTGYTRTGLAIGDTLLLGNYTFVLSQDPLVDPLSGHLQVTLWPISNFGRIVRPFAPSADIPVSTWAFHAPAVVSVSIAKDLYKYEYTSFHTYTTDRAELDTTISFLELETDPAKEHLTTVGFGVPGTTIPRKDTRTEILKLDDGTGNPDGAWRRKAEYFVLETTEPIKGRLQLNIKPKIGTIPNSLGTFEIIAAGFDITAAFPAGRLIISVVWGGGLTRPVGFSVGDAFLISANMPMLAAVWTSAFEAGPFTIATLADVAATPGAPTGTLTNFQVAWPAAVPPPADGANVTITAPTNISRLFVGSDVGRGTIGDVYLIKGAQAERFQVVDDIVFPIQYPLSFNVLLDSTQHKTDELDNILPKGCVLLYAGGGVCPSGFKRLDGFANSEEPGLPDNYRIPIPDPLLGESISYDADTNRTQLAWSHDFPALDETGATIPLVELAVPITASIPNSAPPGQPDIQETVSNASVQQVMQPGMKLRYPSFTTPLSVLNPATGNPLFSSTLPGRGVRTIPAQAGVLRLFAYDKIKIGNAYPNHNSVTIELWARINTLPTTSAVLAQQRTGGGWEISIDSLGNVTVLISQGAVSKSYTTPGRPLANLFVGGTNDLFLQFYAYIQPYVANGGLEDQSYLEIRTGDVGSTSSQVLFASSFVLPSGLTTMFTNSDIWLGRSSTGTNNSSLDCLFDSFRVFNGNALTLTLDDLFNDGMGLADLSLFPGASSALLAEYRLDEVAGTSLLNTAPGSEAFHGQSEGGVLRELGHIKIAGAGSFPTKAFGTTREAVTPSFLITNVEYAFVNDTTSFEPVAPYKTSGTALGSGAKGFLPNNTGSAAITVPYVFSIKSGTGQGPPTDLMDISAADLDTAPPGPLLPSDQTARVNGKILGAPGSGTYVPRIIHAPLSGGSISSLEIGLFDSSTGPNNTTENVFNSTLTVGDVYYCTWLNPNTGARGACFCRVSSINRSTWRITLVRYDATVFSRSMTPLGGGSGYGQMTFRPAILFGKAAQGFDVATHSIQIPGITTTRTVAGGVVYWTYRLFSYQTTVSVYGYLAPVSGLDFLYLEPSGYLVYDDPLTNIRYGTSGHSHLVDQGDVISSTSLIPRVNEINTVYSALPFTAVASKHTHGFLSKYRYTLPKFKMFTLCEKL